MEALKKTVYTLALTALFVMVPMSATHAFAVSPASIDVTAERGEVVNKTFTLINEADREKTFHFDTIKFVPREDGAGPRFISPSEDRSGLAEWIAFDAESMRVPAHSQAQIPFQVAVPADVDAGGYYAAVMISDAPSDVVSRNGAIIEAKTALLIFLTVEGETDRTAGLLDFHPQQETGVQSTPVFSYVYRMQNQGNVHVTPAGQVVATDVFGRTIASMDANPGDGKILPNSTRTYQGTIGTEPEHAFQTIGAQLERFAIGPVDVSLRVKYADEKPMIQESYRVWLFPWESLLVIGTAGFLGFLFYRIVAKGLKKSSS